MTCAMVSTVVIPGESSATENGAETVSFLHEPVLMILSSDLACNYVRQKIASDGIGAILPGEHKRFTGARGTRINTGENQTSPNTSKAIEYI